MARRRLGFWRRFSVCLARPVLALFTAGEWLGYAHIPAEGGAIVVVNHISHADPLISGWFLHRAGRWPQFLGKASLFRLPLLGPLLDRVDQIPVERGTVDAARSLERLVRAVRAGGVVVIYPEGTTTREPELWPMVGKTGAARLALATRAPVIPVAIWGAQQIFDPRTGILRLRLRTPVTAKAGPPIDLSRFRHTDPSRETLAEMTDVIMTTLRDMLAEIRGGTPPPLYRPAPTGRYRAVEGDRGRPIEDAA
ncbi:1-acyl-sn-glycerol-3-phosphate acyltransferase [Pilimelia terevasa]|uniref:1-acyl-sn-glycerol-3-phosphate acyltransferase n=1 Tax=Pilimelia terevasa TaxID=53372 RepID=A0A8J3BQC7_9ACTN|nr:lysophospholipid acyltransferase family protein [Pilimelia terevasa]GGK28455.1 1-acyl-sn-glycerol-3-phosphate acyltransferase [Pilimelia terevasa]